jgi:hypothetical protein
MRCHTGFQRRERPGHGPKTWWLQALVAVNRSLPAFENQSPPGKRRHEERENLDLAARSGLGDVVAVQQCSGALAFR